MGAGITAPKSYRACAIGLSVWLVAVVGGMLALIGYSNVPGRPASGQTEWPGESSIAPDGDCATLLMFVHPKCPCTRASLNQLARTLTMTRVPVDIQVIVFCPHDRPESWAHTGLWKVAAKLASSPPMIDRGGIEARRFGVTTSGHTLLFAPGGMRQFSGGITSGRAHEGDNLGGLAIQRLLNGESPAPVVFPVYGCKILGDVGASE